MLALAYATGLGGLSLARHDAFATGRFDLGNMVQAVWTTAHGHLLESTDVSGERFSRLGAHVDPVLVLFAPLARLWPIPETLLVAQALIVALGIFPAFWLGRRWLRDDRLALAAAAAYALYPPLQWAVLFDFHPVTLAAPLLLFAIWAAEEGRAVPLVACGALAALTQEQVGIAVAMIALWMAVRHPARRRLAALMGGGALAWVAVAVLVIIPSFALDGGSPHIQRYHALGDDPGGVLTSLVLRPWEAVGVIATPGRAGYLALLLAPLLALSLRAPLLLAGAVPQLVINLLAETGPAQTIEYHYAATLAPFLVASAILGLARLRRGAGPRLLGRAVARPGAVAVVLVAAGVLAGARLGPLPIWSGVPLAWGGSSHMTFTGDAQSRALERAVRLVPERARVSASNAPGARLSARRTIYLFPVVRDAGWVVVVTGGRTEEAADGRKTLRVADHDRAVALLERNVRWQLLLDQDGVRVFRRIRPARTAPAGRRDDPPPAQAPSGTGR